MSYLFENDLFIPFNAVLCSFFENKTNECISFMFLSNSIL